MGEVYGSGQSGIMTGKYILSNILSGIYNWYGGLVYRNGVYLSNWGGLLAWQKLTGKPVSNLIDSESIYSIISMVNA